MHGQLVGNLHFFIDNLMNLNLHTYILLPTDKFNLKIFGLQKMERFVSVEYLHFPRFRKYLTFYSNSATIEIN